MTENDNHRYDGPPSAVIDGRFVLIQAVIGGKTQTLYTLPADDLSESLRKLKTNDFRWQVIDGVKRSRDKEANQNSTVDESVRGVVITNSFADKSASHSVRRSHSLTPTGDRYDRNHHGTHTDLEYNSDSDYHRESRSRTKTKINEEFPVNETRTCLLNDCVECRKGSGRCLNGAGRRRRHHHRHTRSNRRHGNEADIRSVAVASYQPVKSAASKQNLERQRPSENWAARSEDLNLVGRTVNVKHGPRMLACKT
jgi:hypothetical protein